MALLPAVILTPSSALSVIVLTAAVYLVGCGATRGSIRATSLRGVSAPLFLALFMPPEIGAAWTIVGVVVGLVLLEAARDRWRWLRVDPLTTSAALMLWASGTGLGIEASLASSGALLDRLASIPPGDLLVKNSSAGLMGLMAPVALLLAALWGVFRKCVDWRAVSACAMAFVLGTLCLPLPGGRMPMLLDDGLGPVAAVGAAMTMLVATPAGMCILLLINRPHARPMSPLPRRLWSACTGVAIALAGLHVAPLWGAPLAVALMSLFAPAFDRFVNRPLPIDARRCPS